MVLKHLQWLICPKTKPNQINLTVWRKYNYQNNPKLDKFTPIVDIERFGYINLLEDFKFTKSVVKFIKFSIILFFFLSSYHSMYSFPLFNIFTNPLSCLLTLLTQKFNEKRLSLYRCGKTLSFSLYIYIYIYRCMYVYDDNDQVVLTARSSLFLSYHPSLSSVTSGWSSRLHPVSVQHWCVFLLLG